MVLTSRQDGAEGSAWAVNDAVLSVAFYAGSEGTPRQYRIRWEVELIGGRGRDQRIDHRFHFALLRCIQQQQRPANGPAIVSAEIHGAFHAGDANCLTIFLEAGKIWRFK